MSDQPTIKLSRQMRAKTTVRDNNDTKKIPKFETNN